MQNVIITCHFTRRDLFEVAACEGGRGGGNSAALDVLVLLAGVAAVEVVVASSSAFRFDALEVFFTGASGSTLIFVSATLGLTSAFLAPRPLLLEGAKVGATTSVSAVFDPPLRLDLDDFGGDSLSIVSAASFFSSLGVTLDDFLAFDGSGSSFTLSCRVFLRRVEDETDSSVLVAFAGCTSGSASGFLFLDGRLEVDLAAGFAGSGFFLGDGDFLGCCFAFFFGEGVGGSGSSGTFSAFLFDLCGVAFTGFSSSLGAVEGAAFCLPLLRLGAVEVASFIGLSSSSVTSTCLLLLAEALLFDFTGS